MDEVSVHSVRQTSGFIPTPPATTDLAEYIPGMYRILDLVSEQGSGGLGKYDADSRCIQLLSHAQWIRLSFLRNPLVGL